MKQKKYRYPHDKDKLAKHLLSPSQKGWSVTVAPYSVKRSVEQNAVAHGWYAQIARKLGEDTPEAVKRECKLLYGVPIIRADDEELNMLFSQILDPYNHENQLLAMRLIDVTSAMSTAQGLEYMNTLQRVYAGRVDLRYPNEPPMENVA